MQALPNSLSGIRSIIIVKTFTSNRLTTTSRTRLQITTKQVKLASQHTTIVTLRKLQVIGSAAIPYPGKLLAIDDKMRRYLGRHFVTMPSWLIIIPRHIRCGLTF